MSSPFDSALNNEKKKKLLHAHEMMAIKGGGGSGATIVNGMPFMIGSLSTNQQEEEDST